MEIRAKDCDDDNTVTDDGCTPLCNINTGWKCKNGTNTGPDDCYEICGDGYDYHTYDCDDGNLIDGDGCSSTCELEDPDYKCQYGDFPWPDICEMGCTVRATDFGELPCIDSNSSPLDGYVIQTTQKFIHLFSYLILVTLYPFKIYLIRLQTIVHSSFVNMSYLL